MLNAFDQLIDVPGSRLTLATDELTHSGQSLEIDEFMGIPIVSDTVNSQFLRLSFATGSQVSYLQDEIIQTFPPAGTMQDSYPGFGRFDTDIHLVPISLGAGLISQPSDGSSRGNQILDQSNGQNHLRLR